jgi:ABC-2 type transport system permease protein
MGTLIGIEIRRLLARRLFRILIALSLLGIAIAGIVVFFRSSDEPPPSSEVVVTDPLLEAEIDRCQRGEFGPLPGGEAQPSRRECIEFMDIRNPDPRYHLADVRDTFMGTTVPLAVMAWLLGASFIGAEWQKGTMATTLLWEPRRIRLVAAKVIACCATIFVVFVTLQIVLALALTPAGLLRGTTEGIGGEWLRSTAGVLARGGIVAVVAAMIGFSIAGLGRNTAAALGVGFLYMTVIEGLVRGLRPNWVPWLLADNAAVFITNDPLIMPALERSTIEAGLLIAGYAAALTVVGALVFRWRDVT